MKSGFDFIDFWAVDFDWKPSKPFNHHWQDILKGKRADYGKQILHALSAKLQVEFGRGFGRRNLFRMIRFAEVFPDPEIVSALMTQLGWIHFLHIIPMDDPLKRDFYAEMCRLQVRRCRVMTSPLRQSILNLPPEQGLTQRLVDDFNNDEAAWRQRLRKALESISKRQECTGEQMV